MDDAPNVTPGQPPVPAWRPTHLAAADTEAPAPPAPPAVPGQFQPPLPPAQFGSPAQFPPAQAFGNVPTPPGHPGFSVAPVRRAGTPRWVVALVVGVVGLVVLGIGAAVAVPALLQQRLRGEWAATRVDLPGTLLDLPRAPAAEASLAAVLDQLPSGSRLALYSNGRANLLLIALRPAHPLIGAQQAAEWAALTGSLAASGLTLPALVDRDPGPLGGRFACGSDATSTMCLSVDSGAVLAVVATGVPGGADAVAPVRATVETRR